MGKLAAWCSARTRLRLSPGLPRDSLAVVNAFRLFVLSVFFSCTLAATPTPADWTQSPVVVVSENVNVSVGERMALVSGSYWYQYVPKFDDQGTRVAINYTAIVPSGITAFADLLEVSQIKLLLGQREFRPETARVLTDEETGPVPTLPAGAAIAWFTFQIPRNLAELRFEVLISHFQPHYTYENKTVAAFWPWMPNLEKLRQDLELLNKNFVVTFEALPGVTMEPLTTNTNVEMNTPKRFIVHPLHEETIAVAVTYRVPSAAD